MHTYARVTALIIFMLLPSAGAKAAEPSDADATTASASSAPAAGHGELSPLLVGAAVGERRAVAVGGAGYDTARGSALFDSLAEVAIVRWLAVRATVAYSPDAQRVRPGVGARLQALRENAHGVDASVTASFKAEGFNEPEGEIETVLAVGRHAGPYYLLANVAYGQDPEGNERDGEARASVLRQTGRMTFGAEARCRAALGAQHGMFSAVEPRLDAAGGALAMLSSGPFVFFAEAGPSVFRRSGADARWGIVSVAGIGSVF